LRKRLKFWRRNLREPHLEPEEIERLARENEIARRDHGNPFPFGGQDPMTKSLGTNGKMNTPTSIIGTPLDD
jgi:hypothetical protein